MIGARNGSRTARKETGWREFASIFRFARARLAVLCVLSTVAGVIEASVLIAVVQIAVLITSGKETITRSIGPLGDSTLSIEWLFVVTFGLTLLRFALMILAAWWTARIGVSVLTRVRRSSLQAFLAASWDLQSREKEGRLQDLMSTNGQKVAQANLTLAGGLSATVTVLTLLVTAFSVQPAATGVIMVSMAVLFFVLRPLTMSARRASRDQSEANLEYSSALSQAVRVALEIKIYNVSGAVRDRIDRLIDDVARPFFRTRFLALTLPASYQNMSILFILVGLVVLHLIDVSDLAGLVGVILILLRALRRSETAQDAYHTMNELLPFVQKLLETQQEYERHAVRHGGAPLAAVDRLSFEHVSFSYVPGLPVIRDFSFEIERGESIGIVGPSGSGKSTMVQLLLRLREPDEGRYLVNGEDAAGFDLDDWYHRMTFLPQEPRLISGSVAENIRFYRDLDDAAVERAARLAHIHDEVMAFPNGYDTDTGERGGGAVSGGQRQRICLARALATDPDVLILDEPTSSLDLRSEALVQRTLGELRGRVTVIIIAHRLSTLKMCDRTMVLSEGKLEHFSTRGALLETNDFYREVSALSQLS